MEERAGIRWRTKNEGENNSEAIESLSFVTFLSPDRAPIHFPSLPLIRYRHIHIDKVEVFFVSVYSLLPRGGKALAGLSQKKIWEKGREEGIRVTKNDVRM
jgi:hypothetical protein